MMKLLFLSFALLNLNALAAPTTVIGENEIEKLKDLDAQSEVYLKSVPTGRLKLPGKLGIHDFCTVSLISVNEVLTASHCLTKRDPLAMTAYFEYYTKASKNNRPFIVKEVVLNVPDADIAILKLEGEPGLIYGYYSFAKQLPAINDALIVFQHPGLDEKSVSRKNCFLVMSEEAYIEHSCDTENYSSGSPILNKNFEIIGVHQGVHATNSQIFNYGHNVVGLR
jgi:V8-like Glu-specific endopeptidase